MSCVEMRRSKGVEIDGPDILHSVAWFRRTWGLRLYFLQLEEVWLTSAAANVQIQRLGARLAGEMCENHRTVAFLALRCLIKLFSQGPTPLLHEAKEPGARLVLR